MLNDLRSLFLFSLSATDIMMNIFIALLCGFLIAWLYRLTYRGPGYTPSFVNALVLLSMITAIVIMIIGNNLARAFGLVGAMSIIRFRTAIKDIIDIIFIFFSLTIGMAAGVGYYKIAIIGTLFIGVILLIFSKSKIAAPKKKEYLLQFFYHPDGSEIPRYQNVLQQFCRKYNIINIKSVEEHDILELSYYIRLKDSEKNNEFIQNLRSINGIHNINLFFDREDI